MLKKIMVSLMIILFIFAVILLVGFLFLRFWPSVGRTPSREEQNRYADKTEYFYDGMFHNRGVVPVTVSGKDVKSKRLTPTDTIPVVKSESIPKGEKGKLYVMWLGHSSLLVQLGEKNILIDPVFSDRSSPVSFAGPKRFSEVPIEPEKLPTIDVLLISHDHYDHLDYKTIKALDGRVKKYVVPLGVECYLKGWGIDENKIEALAWYDEINLEGVDVAATPSYHFTGRNPLKSESTWWCGYYFRDESHSVYYSGDGSYSVVDGDEKGNTFDEGGSYEVDVGEGGSVTENSRSLFSEITEMYGSADLAFVECGQYGRGWPTLHMFPDQTIKACEDLKAEWYIPVHWATFCICYNDWDDSIIRFTEGVKDTDIKYATPRIGQRVDFDDIESFNEQWWIGIN